MYDAVSKQKAYEHRWLILLVISLGVLAITLASSMVNIALPTIQRELSATMSQLQWIVNAYLLLFAGLMILMGAVADRIGHRLMFALGLTVFAGANIGSMAAASATALIIWRCAAGIGAAMLLPTTLAIVRTIFADEERGKAIGIWAGLNSIGIALGPIIGGALVDGFSWNSVFFFSIPVAAVAICAGIVLLPKGRSRNDSPLDVLGSILATAAITALVFGLIRGGDRGWSDAGVIAALAGGIAGSAVFVIWESRCKNPILNLRFFKNRNFSSGVGAVFIMSLALVGISFTLTLLMQFVRGYSALQTGVRLLPFAGGIFIGAGTADSLVKRFGRRTVITTGFAGTACTAFGIAFFSVGTGYWILALAYFFLGFFLGYIAAPATDAIMSAAPEEQAGVVSSTNTVARTVAGAIGVALLGAILSSVYTSSFLDNLSSVGGLPDELSKVASESVGAAVVIAESLPETMGAALKQLAHESFMDGWRVLAFISCAVSLLGAGISARFVTPVGKKT
ncbi:MAG: MFS transporter [Spirochaetales bacterium]|nr:MFS transporter [Spirochaetales bacterium]